MQKQADTVKRAQEELSPERYAEFLEKLDLTNIYLKELRSSLSSNKLTGQNSFEVHEDTKLVTSDANNAELQVTYKLVAKSGRKKIVSATAKYVAVFATKEQLPPAFYEIFKHFSLPLHTFPYFRECVNSLFSRMGLPPLILPLRKFLVGDSKNKGATTH